MFTSYLPARVWDPSQSDDFLLEIYQCLSRTQFFFLRGGGSGGTEIKFDPRF